MEIKRRPDEDIVEYSFDVAQFTREEYIAKWDRYLHREAYRTWNRLPPQVKLWIDQEDLYQEAYMEAIACYERWDPALSGFSTYLYPGVQLKLRQIVAYWTTKKRFPTQLVEEKVIEYETKPHFAPPILDAVTASMAKENERLTYLTMVMSKLRHTALAIQYGSGACLIAREF